MIPVGGNHRFAPGVFEVIENGTERVVVYVSGTGLAMFSFTVGGATAPTASAPQALCLPGTWLSGKVETIRLTADGKALLIADTYNGRILEYFIRDSAGNLAFSTSCN